MIFCQNFPLSSDRKVLTIFALCFHRKEIQMSTRYRDKLVTSRKPADIAAYKATLDAHPQIRGHAGKIGSIHIAPIKSLAMVEVSTVQLTKEGLLWENAFFDRSAMIGIRVTGKPYEFERFSMREASWLTHTRALFHGGHLVYETDHLDRLIIAPEELMPKMRRPVRVKITSDENDVNDAVLENGPITEWVRRLVTLYDSGTCNPEDIEVLLRPDTFNRPVIDRLGGHVPSQTLFSDGGQLLIASSSTLAWMNEQIRSNNPAHQDLLMDAFRPNIVLDDLPPNVEDLILQIEISGRTLLLFADPCVRCAVTKVDQATGMPRADKQPLAFLAKHRPPRISDGVGVTFGINAVWDYGNREKVAFIGVGDSFCIEEEK